MGLRACEKGSPICVGYFNKEEEIVGDPRCSVLAKNDVLRSTKQNIEPQKGLPLSLRMSPFAVPVSRLLWGFLRDMLNNVPWHSF